MVGIFCDVPGTTSRVNSTFPESVKINYVALMKYFEENLDIIVSAYCISSIKTVDQETKAVSCKTEPFLDMLRYNGYRVFTQIFKDIEGPYYFSWVSRITIDIMLMLDRVDTLILVSSNSDFTPVLEHAQSRGIKTIIIGCDIAGGMQSRANEVVELETIPEIFLK